ncbi:MAG: hypothetical protein GY928_26360 [Colwellia sp.]|nr:hypothetical protein [Colwellia sp.]
MKFLFISLILLCTPCFTGFSENLRWSLDASARLNHNEVIDNTNRIYALGLDTHKIFSQSTGDIGYGVGQLYYTKLSNHLPVHFLFDLKDDGDFIIREAHLNYTDTPSWLPNIRLGHFTMLFGLEESIDTNGRLLDYNHGQNLETKLDWGLGLNKVVGLLEYNLSYTLGGKDKAKSINGSYAVTGRIGTLSHLDSIVGFSIFRAKIDGNNRKIIAIDWQYYWQTWGGLAEIAIGEDDKQSMKWQQEKYALDESNKTSADGQLKVYIPVTIQST